MYSQNAPQNNHNWTLRIRHKPQTFPYHQPACNHIRKVEHLEKDLRDAMSDITRMDVYRTMQVFHGSSLDANKYAKQNLFKWSHTCLNPRRRSDLSSSVNMFSVDVSSAYACICVTGVYYVRTQAPHQLRQLCTRWVSLLAILHYVAICTGSYERTLPQRRSEFGRETTTADGDVRLKAGDQRQLSGHCDMVKGVNLKEYRK